MNKILRLGARLLILFGFFANAQDIIWTGSALNKDFFDEQNWKNSATNLAPSAGSIDPGQAINLSLIIDNPVDIIQATGEINIGNGTLGISMANVVAQSFSGPQGTITINDGAYIELTDTTPFKSPTTPVQINFTSGLAWIKTTNTAARIVLLTYLGQIKVNGLASSYKTNLRLDNYYFKGCVIRSNLASTTPLTVYDETNLQGTPVLIPVNTIQSGNAIPGAINNKMESFILKKGYMVTFADEADGTGSSKNYIASESDLLINAFPKVLQNSISFIRVMPWNWVTKKGFNAPVDGNLNASWRYQWNGNESSPVSYEFAPMSWGQGSADDTGVAGFINLYNTTHLMSFNEPDDCTGQSGQYGDPQLCVVTEAVKWHKNLMKTGMRMVSPGGREEATKDGQWLEKFYNEAKKQNVRIDVIAVHWYDWGSSPKVNTNPTALQVFNRFKTYLTNVHNKFRLPIWITEFNANPARSQAVNAGFLALALPYLESLDYIERYCWFPFNSGTHFTGWNDATKTPSNTTPSLVGTIYKNINNTTPVASTPAIPEATVNADNNLNLDLFPNIALNKPTIANSSSSTSFLPALAVDGDNSLITSQWSVNIGNSTTANFSPLPAWIEVDLQDSYIVDSFQIFESSNALKDFNFQVWDSALNSGAGGWSNVLTVTGNPALPLTTFKTISPITTTKVRLYITAHNSTTLIRLLELEVYGKAASNLGVTKYNKQMFTIYPNPVTNGLLNISGDQDVQSVDVYNIVGAKINAHYENGQLEISHLTPGIYFLKVNDKYSFKFIKK